MEPRMSSSSSLSFSFSSMDDQPSTSGCSSDMAYGARNSQMKKEKVKQYLKTLVSMVGPSNRRKMSTLSTLQHVVDSVRKITDMKSVPTSQMCQNEHVSLPTPKMDSRLLTKSDHDLIILISMKKHVVHQVTPSLMLKLEYPIDFWKGRIITDFIYRRDILTFNNNLMVDFDVDELAQLSETTEDSQADAQDQTKTFYIRFRCFKTILKGYNLKRPASFQPFQVNIVATSASKSGNDSVPKPRRTLMLKLVELESPYRVYGQLPEQRTFCMRHTMFCAVSHIHSNAIPLLGYLPQDIIGLSIFEVYHPDDLPVLYQIHQQVLESKGKPIKESRMRLKARNGEWIEVQTQWSSFVDPWTKKLEFIMGQHTVISAPAAIDVFEENYTNRRQSSDQLSEAHKYQQMIRNLLQTKNPPTEPLEIKIEPQITTLVQDNTFLVPDKEVIKSREAKEVVKSEESEEDTTVFYNQLNYSHNIKRYLMSQRFPGNLFTPAEGLPHVFPKSEAIPQVSEGCMAPIIEDIEPPDFPVNIKFTKPPSYGSSTIVHVSEHREDTIPSPPQPEAVEDPTIPWRVPNMILGPIPQYPQVELTQEVLKKHTKLQEKLLLQQAEHDDNILFLGKQEKEEVRDKKRSLSGSASLGNEPSQTKISKLDRGKPVDTPVTSGDVFPSPFSFPMLPLSTGNMIPTSLAPTQSHPIFTQNPPPEFLSMGLPGIQQNIPMYMQQIPMMQVDPNTGLATPVMPMYQNTAPMEPPRSAQGMQWPYFQQTGVSFVPQVMGGFYQTLTGMFQPFPMPRMNVEMSETQRQSTQPIPTSTSTPMKTGAQLHPQFPMGEAEATRNDSSSRIESSRLDSSTGNDTDSSLMYILEASSSVNNSSREDPTSEVKREIPHRVVKASKRYCQPFWLAKSKWTNDVKMRYQLPQRILKNVLKADREAMKKLDKGNNTVTEQLEELLTFIAKNERVMDEEAGFLLFENETVDDNASVNSESSLCCTDHADQLLGLQLDNSKGERRSTLTESKEENSPDIEEVYRQWREECNDEMIVSVSPQEYKDSTSSDEDKNDSKKMGENDSNVSNNYKDTSDITPSDQRSSEEAGSSLKESSDCSSKDQKYSSCDSDTELRPECALIDCLFVKLPTGQKSSKKCLAEPFWRQEAEHDEDIAKTYQLSEKSEADILRRDLCSLDHLKQPQTVIEQMRELSRYTESQSVHPEGTSDVTQENMMEGPSFNIDVNVFSNLFLPTGGVHTTDASKGSQPIENELSEEELMMLD
ncbi:period circadian protein homolog 1-like isoform X2 [Haliotis rufescens]|uniref:period circadian protein homolog 1-like isoform X2 n=1 Tax=Haliotis rufescens TaxID=6454 RepID=UPI00201EC3FE|nr:period circadian protein homolog 1-like isoform X2 [Haliotis rufescens]